MSSNLLNTNEIAEYLNLKPVTVRRKAAKGEIPSIKIGKRFRFDKHQIDSWLSQQTSGVSRHILVIDDEPAVGQLIKGILEMNGHQVTTTLSSLEALEIITQKRFDLIFLDLVMPGLDGSELFKRIRQVDNDAKVIIVTGYPDSDLMKRAAEQGPFLVIQKPFAINDILEAVCSFSRRMATEGQK